ncbi:hypothetical protein ANN_27439 [Periplaneta americana]|uniref:C2H2-type domain-containing protein n=1 Tax=Periplaneta americana TaxID=6978 RepID=A0ABQ8RVV7_PERAM|nr:hypothetical protein ANN_27439 [Periplaneta americana]
MFGTVTKDCVRKNVFHKSADKNSIKHTTMRVLLFQIIAPGIPLPPQPVLARWGTWLDAVNYYAEHYGKIMEVIDPLANTDSSAVAAVKSLPSEQLLEDILFIDSNFKIVSKSITLLESSKLQLSEALNIVDNITEPLLSIVMDEIKMEPGVDPLELQPHDNTWKIEENNILSEQGTLLNLQAMGMKTESCFDTSWIKIEDQPVMKCEGEEYSFDLERVQQEQKMEMSTEEDEVVTESIVDKVGKTESSESDGIIRDEELIQHSNNRLNSSFVGDTNHDSFTCNIFNKVFVTPPIQKGNFRFHSSKNSLKCDVCGKGFFQLSSLKNHILIHTGEMPFLCEVCGKSFRLFHHLKNHERSHTGEKPFTCDVCGKGFSHSGQRIKHLRIHAEERPYKCDVCGECFSVAGNLKHHTRTHISERPFKCDVCGKCFSASRNLKQHALLHTENKEINCDVCGKCIRGLRNLKRHKRLHDGERPLICDVCGKCFAQSGQLKIHIRLHTGERPFKCDVCGKCFLESRTLKNHSRIHTGERPYMCDVCGKCFLQSGHLKDHSSTHRGDRSFECDVSVLLELIPKSGDKSAKAWCERKRADEPIKIEAERKKGPLVLVVMDWIKMEPEVDPLGLQPHDNTYKMEENMDSLKERNPSEQLTTNVKTEYVDDSYKFTSEIKVEEGIVPFDSSGMKCEAEFKVCYGSLYAVMWLADEPREFNLPTLLQRCITYEVEKMPTKYGVHSEEYLPIHKVTPVVAGM